jgi:hypothetical protein
LFRWQDPGFDFFRAVQSPDFRAQIRREKSTTYTSDTLCPFHSKLPFCPVASKLGKLKTRPLFNRANPIREAIPRKTEIDGFWLM